MILYLKKPFCSAHFYTQKQWSEEKNLEVFGRCHTEYGHGHNYVLEVGFQTSPATLHADRKVYSNILSALTHRVDHEHLNFVIPEFQDKIPTTENISLYFFDKLKEVLPLEKISSVKLNEMDTLWTEMRP